MADAIDDLIDHYRAQATRCLRRAKQAALPTTREKYEEAARRWEIFAAMLERPPKEGGL